MILTRLPTICTLLLCIVIAGGAYWQIFPLFQPQGTANTLPSIQQIASTQAPVKKTHNIANFKLFGDTNLKQTPIAEVQKALPKTKLKLTLTGVVVSHKTQGAGALILGPDRETKYYKINDALPGGASLKQVFADRVVVNRSGRLENLYFVETKTSGIERLVTYEEPEETTQAPTRPTPNITQNNGGNGLSQARSKSIKDRLRKLKTRLMKNK